MLRGIQWGFGRLLTVIPHLSQAAYLSGQMLVKSIS